MCFFTPDFSDSRFYAWFLELISVFYSFASHGISDESHGKHRITECATS